MEVLESKGATGSSTVVNVIANSVITQSAERMVRALKLSGLCGYDFILDPRDGRAHLIDFNPRATQTCHLKSSDGKRLLSLLAAKIQGSSVDADFHPKFYGPVVLFPHGFNPDLKKTYSSYADSDLPANSSELEELGLECDNEISALSLRSVVR